MSDNAVSGQQSNAVQSTVDGTNVPDTVEFEPSRITETQRVWSKVYGRQVSEQEAIAILRHVRRYAKALAEGLRK
jgi:hypothetical protein